MKTKLIKLFSLALLALTSLTALFACGGDSSDGAISGEGGKGEGGGDDGYHLCEYTTLVLEEEPTCELQGRKVYACECGAQRTEDIDALGHDYGEWEVTKAPDLFDYGHIGRTCTRNSEHSQGDNLPPLDPDNTEYTVEVTKAPTITEIGEATYTISRQGKEFAIEGDYLHPCYGTNFSLVGSKTVSFSAYYAEEGEIGESFTVLGKYGDFDVTSAGFRNHVGVKTLTVASTGTRISCPGCTTLETVILPEGYTEITHLSYEGAFEGCTSLSSINIPSTVTTIGERAFANCTSLETLTLGNNVSSIGSYAFQNSGLVSITLPSGITELQRSLFYGCESLESITIPEGVTSIGIGVFSDCSSLSEVTLPSTLESIGGSAFYGCESLIYVNYGGSVADWCAVSLETATANPMNNPEAGFRFSGDSPYVVNTYYVTGALAQPTPISHFFFIIPEGVESIGKYQFYGLLKGDEPRTLIIEGDVTSIGEGAFGNCNIQHIRISKSVTSIDSYAFDGAQLDDNSEIYYGGSAAEFESSPLNNITELSDCDVKYYGADWRFNDDGHVEETVDGASWFLEESVSPYYNEEYPE